MRELLSALEERLDEQSAKGLAQAVSAAIRDGVLTPGDRLPPIRRVAEQLMLSPTTVNAAWQLLARSGALRSDGRRGTTVSGTPGGDRYASVLRHEGSSRLDLSTGVPDARLLPDLTAALASLDGRTVPGSYLDDPVLPELREALVGTWPHPPEELLVVDGAMDALDLLTRSLLRPGDRVLVEDPGFPPLLDLLEERGVVVDAVRLDREGPAPDVLTARLARRPVAFFLQPRAQNPTGVSLSPARARTLAGLLADTSCLVIEDDSAGDVASSAAVSLGTWLPDQVVHVRSFSKSHGPDLRLAAMSGPGAALAPVRRARALGQGWSSRLLQRALAHLLTDAAAIDTVSRARDEYSRRGALVVGRLREHGIDVPGTDGLNIWVPVRDEAAAVLRLAREGVAVAPGSPFAVARTTATAHIRVTTGLVEQGHAELADLLAHAADASAWSSRHR